MGIGITGIGTTGIIGTGITITGIDTGIITSILTGIGITGNIITSIDTGIVTGIGISIGTGIGISTTIGTGIDNFNHGVIQQLTSSNGHPTPERIPGRTGCLIHPCFFLPPLRPTVLTVREGQAESIGHCWDSMQLQGDLCQDRQCAFRPDE